MAGRGSWAVENAEGLVVETFATRTAARAYAREHGLRGRAEYRARIEPKLRAGASLAQARGHPPGSARHVAKHRTRAGNVVREQYTIGLAGMEGRDISVREARRRLRAFRRANPDLAEVGVGLHGKPYKQRKETKRWTGFVQNLDDLEQQLENADEDGIELLADVTGLADRAAWESIDELTLYRPA